MKRAWKQRNSREDGFVTIWILGICFIMLGLGGISLDMWRGLSERRELTAITDAAAVAGASHIDLAEFKKTDTKLYRDKTNPKPIPLNEAEARQAALTYMDQQAAESDFTYSSVTITFDNEEIHIAATREINTTLLRIFRPGTTLEVKSESASSPALGI